MVSSFYVSIKVFFETSFRELTGSAAFHKSSPWLWRFFNGAPGTLGFHVVFAYSYVSLLMATVLVSIAVPIDRAMPYFRVISVLFSVWTVASIAGISVFLAETGFFIREMQYHGADANPPW
jgi:hypothetical protein